MKETRIFGPIKRKKYIFGQILKPNLKKHTQKTLIPTLARYPKLCLNTVGPF